MADFKTLESNFVGARSISSSFLSSLGLISGLSKGSATGCTETLAQVEVVVSPFLIPLEDILDDDGTSLTLSSDNAADDSAGIGARTVFLELLNDDFITSSQVITMDGQTPVSVPGTFSRFQMMEVLTAGADLIPNIGTIYLGEGTVTAGVPDIVHGTIDPLLGRSLMSHFTVPKNRTAVVSTLSLTASATGNNDVTFFIKRRLNAGDGGEPFVTLDDFKVFKDSVSLIGNPLYTFGEKTDIAITAKASAGNTNSASVKAGFDVVTNSRLEP